MADLDVRLLRYFLAAAEELSFTRAAQRLHVTQQSLSAAMKQLEACLGVEVFDRSTRHVALTFAGTVLVGHARSALAAVETARAETVAAAGRLQGPLAVCSTEDIEYLVTPLLARFAAQHADVDVRLALNVDNGRVLQDLKEGRLDVAISHCLHADDPSLGRCILGWEDVVVAVPDDTDMAAMPSVPRRRLQAQALLLFARHLAPGLWDLLTRELSVQGSVHEVRQLRSGQSAQLTAAAAGRGITVVTPRVFAKESPPGLTARPLDPPLRVPVDLVWRRPSSAAVNALATVARCGVEA